MGFSNKDEPIGEDSYLHQIIEQLKKDKCPCCGHGKKCTLHICDKSECAENKKLIGKLRIMAENLHPTLGKSILDAVNIIEQLQTK
ncbi:hypothetical protein LCGC14_1238500 [marine sediment metagenome]|uniref:Uncharacterized protein n=1 Tax=marine sediment metagenome TaxID=412755 RepID=A0A0F9PAP8_9ZZZZ